MYSGAWPCKALHISSRALKQSLPRVTKEPVHRSYTLCLGSGEFLKGIYVTCKMMFMFCFMYVILSLLPTP